jgi:hypothetical protein
MLQWKMNSTLRYQAGMDEPTKKNKRKIAGAKAVESKGPIELSRAAKMAAWSRRHQKADPKNLHRSDRFVSTSFNGFHRTLQSCKDEIQRRIGSGMNTSSTKVMDNAIVGYVRLKIKSEQAAVNPSA